MLQLSSWLPHELTIDGETVQIEVKRLDVDPLDAYKDKLAEFGFIPDGRGPEPEISPADAVERMKERNRQAMVWFREELPQLIRIKPGQIMVDGEEITDVVRFINAFAMRSDGMPLGMLILSVVIENELSPEKKRRLRSRLASGTGSTDVVPTEGNGETPRTTAASAEPPAIAESVAVMAPRNGESSGTTDRSSSIPVLSEA